jgi:hypothetical protein
LPTFSRTTFQCWVLLSIVYNYRVAKVTLYVWPAIALSLSSPASKVRSSTHWARSWEESLKQIPSQVFKSVASHKASHKDSYSTICQKTRCFSCVSLKVDMNSKNIIKLAQSIYLLFLSSFVRSLRFKKHSFNLRKSKRNQKWDNLIESNTIAMIQFNGSKHFEVMTIIMQCCAKKHAMCALNCVNISHNCQYNNYSGFNLTLKSWLQ